MNYYLYFSYYDKRMAYVGFDVIPSSLGFVTPEWVMDNVVVSAPSESAVAVVSLDTVPPSTTPMWLEIVGMEPANNGEQN